MVNELIISNYLNEEIIRIDNGLEMINYEEKGYRKLDHEVAEELDGLMRFVPEIADNIRVGKVYSVKFNKGLGVLQKSKKAPGWYNANVVNPDTNNGIKGQAVMKPIENGTQLIGTMFAVMSVATSQYYLHNINHELSSIGNQIEKIKEFLTDEKNSNLESYQHYFKKVSDEMNFIKDDQQLKQSVLTELQRIQNEIYSSIRLYKRQIEKMRLQFDKKAKAEEIILCMGELYSLINTYKYSLDLYMYGRMLETMLSDNTTENYINIAVSDCRSLCDQYASDFKESKKFYKKYLDSAKAYRENDFLNALNKLQNDKSVPAAFVRGFTGVIAPKVVGAAANYASIKDKEKKEKKKQKQIDLIEDMFDEEKEYEQLNQVVNQLKDYSRLNNEPVELIKNGDDLYIKYEDMNCEFAA